MSPEAPLMEEGLDSLGAVELRNSVDQVLAGAPGRWMLQAVPRSARKGKGLLTF